MSHPSHPPGSSPGVGSAGVRPCRLGIALGSLRLFSLSLEEGATRLGRAADNDIVLTLPEIADHHAVLHRTGSRLVIVAADGETFLQRGKVTARAEVALDDPIELGGYRLIWGREEALEPPGAGDPPGSPTYYPTGPLDGPAATAGQEGTIESVTVIAGRDAGLSLPLRGRPITAGRAPDCDLVLRDDTVSWRHLVIEPSPDGARVRDLGSRNGTYVDGRRVDLAPVTCGATLRAGRTTLRLSGPAGDAAGAERARGGREGLVELVGRGAMMREVYERIREAAGNSLPVLLTGETGTGKDLAARAIHSLGARSAAPFVPVNCSAVPREMVEDELFGHARGAFTGATHDRVGAFDAADGGTIFLDEVGEMPADLQPKLLRVIEDGLVPRVGGGGVRRDFRVIAATNRDPGEAVASRILRRDLYYRLAVVTITLPPLSEHLEDLSALVHHFLAEAAQRSGIPSARDTRVDEAAFLPLREHPWPGNVRELRNLVLRAALRRPGEVITRDLVEELLAGPRIEPGAPPAAGTLEETERAAVENALKDCGGNRRAAARRLGIAESTLYEKIRRYDLGRGRRTD